MNEEFSVIDTYQATGPFIDSLSDAADSHRDALGFFARSVYEEFARQDCLYILLVKRGNANQYAGHLIFSCRYPRATVRQIFVLPEFRGQGNGALLLGKFKFDLTHRGFTSIYARVAEDLNAANAFWQSEQFYVQRIEQGGISRNRRILVRSHELPSPQLFPVSGISGRNPLGIAGASLDEVPLFLLDLNVLFDVMPRRLRHEEMVALLQAERMNSCRLAISDEIEEELKRTNQEGRTDPMKAFVSIFPSFPLVNDQNSSHVISTLRAHIFPNKQLRASDASDLRHLATAISHNLSGFITSDDAILSMAPWIQEEYGLQVVSPAAFKIDTTGSNETSYSVSDESLLRLGKVVSEEEEEVNRLLTTGRLSGSVISTKWNPSASQAMCRVAVWNGERAIGFLAWTGPTPGASGCVVRSMVDESASQADVAGRILLDYALGQLGLLGPQTVSLEIPSQQTLLRDLAIGIGFRATSGGSSLSKFLAGMVFTSGTWKEHREKFIAVGGPKLPSEIPTFEHVDQQIPIVAQDGNRVHIGLDLLETLLGPALLCLPGRPIVITPIRKQFSDALLGHSRQGSLLPRGNVTTYQDRHYLSGPRTLSYFKRGTLMFFYESMKDGGRGELIALCRVRQAYLKRADDLIDELERAVLDELSLSSIGKSQIKTVVSFDSIFYLEQGVPLSTLKRIGCGRPNDLITTRPINEMQSARLLAEAFKKV